jgi:hypothetical protein
LPGMTRHSRSSSFSNSARSGGMVGSHPRLMGRTRAGAGSLGQVSRRYPGREQPGIATGLSSETLQRMPLRESLARSPERGMPVTGLSTRIRNQQPQP